MFRILKKSINVKKKGVKANQLSFDNRSGVLGKVVENP